MSKFAASQECRFCAIAGGALTDAELDSPWMADENNFALASVGGLVPGWSLVLPRNHCLNLGLHLQTDDFLAFVERAVRVVEAKFGRVAIFEHGCTSSSSLTSCGTAHAHLHIVPVSFDLEQASRSFDADLDWIECPVREIPRVAGEAEYLFVASAFNGRETRGMLACLSEGRSQFFRRVIALHLGRPSEFNYRTHPNRSESVRTAEILRAEMNSLKDLAA
ncbi:hypothetical protein N7367_02995 [Stenotrophomonas sp. GD04145]|uniref:hypothetical protein n=1 Tax=Stenotrophomonas sp. GD04145 TaxID=2975436 RepID=UPI0024478F74|nr:hypothetical protein [Stenotrophomonas sp. GD04145]MDH0170423.1 hypothetical protein [Stenotrophomonas sp. GD04145]